jgi:hypothetical protein
MEPNLHGLHYNIQPAALQSKGNQQPSTSYNTIEISGLSRSGSMGRARSDGGGGGSSRRIPSSECFAANSYRSRSSHYKTTNQYFFLVSW